MNLQKDLGKKPIKDVLEFHPQVGQILEKYGIGCLECSIGSCLLQDVVTVHALGDAIEIEIEKEINGYLESCR